MRLKIDATLDYTLPEPADILLGLEVAQTPDQRLIEDRLIVSSPQPLVPIEGEQGFGRRTWAAGEGTFQASYTAIVEIDRAQPEIVPVAAVPLRDLPGLVISYLWPSRYCRSDKLREFAIETFGHLSGGALAAALAQWVRSNLSYVPGSSNEDTDAVETFLQRRGMCRDYAHLTISFARALDLPARMVSAYSWSLDPPDFHAVVEVFLDGGWYLIDPTGLAPIEGLVRIGIGRDAADISFMTIFGSAQLNHQAVTVTRID